MVYEINENKFTLYRVKLNKNVLKSIRTTIVSKYGMLQAGCQSLNRENFRMYANMYQEEIRPVVIKKRSNNSGEVIELVFYQIKNPNLATILIKILNDPDENLRLLVPFIEKLHHMISYEDIEHPKFGFDDSGIEEVYQYYLKIKNQAPEIKPRTFEKLQSSFQISSEDIEHPKTGFNDGNIRQAYETYQQVLETLPKEKVQEIRSGRRFLKSINWDITNEHYQGIEYLPKILETITLIPVYESTVDENSLYCELKEFDIDVTAEDFSNNLISHQITSQVKIKRR